MLAKVPPKRNDGKSSFKSLQKYMEERDVIDPNTGEVIGWEKDSVAVQTNCLDRDTAWREMLAVADMNGRVKDPVYHVTLNWQEGENPTDEQAFEAARKAMKAVGIPTRIMVPRSTPSVPATRTDPADGGTNA